MKKILILITISLFFALSVFAQKDYGFPVDKGKYYKPFIAVGAGVSNNDSYYPIESVSSRANFSLRLHDGLLDYVFDYTLGEEDENGIIDLSANLNLMAPFILAENNIALCKIIHPYLGLGFSWGNNIVANEEGKDKALGIFVSGLELTLPIEPIGIFARGTYKTPIVKRKDSEEIRPGTFRRLAWEFGVKLYLE